ncbi:MAG TPA: class I SAM-dependent methyltransferase family protein [Candidatus Limnocylindrales bacterium]|nr:class I SAM-dependent methyltransferase family protein [Candidatus Limnocylindrales bacterium]
MDWRSWHDGYDDPGSALARRLRVVQHYIRAALDQAPPGPVNVVSVCAGQGRDLLEVLASHRRRDDVAARLVELDPGNVQVARALAQGLPKVDVVQGDAALSDNYAGLVPARIVLLCGVFGNITDEDVERTVAASTQLCAEGGTVIWTRHRNPPDLFPTVCGWFEEHGYEREWASDPDAGFGVGVHRLLGPSSPMQGGQRFFTFYGYKEIPLK